MITSSCSYNHYFINLMREELLFSSTDNVILWHATKEKQNNWIHYLL